MEPVLFKERRRTWSQGSWPPGCSKWGTKFLNNSTQPEDRKGLSAKEGSRVPPFLARASGEGWDVLGRELHQWKKTFHVSPERNQLHLVLMDVRNDKAAWEWTSGTLVMTGTAGGTFPQYRSLLVKEENQCCGGLGGAGY